jgi:outer membrane protein assembly factor BamB
MRKILVMILGLVAAQAQSQFIMPLSTRIDIDHKPGLLWKLKANGPVVASPVIGDTVAYIGSLDSTLYAVDLLTGKVKWALHLGGAIRSSVCHDNERVYQLCSDGFLYRIKKDSGNVDGYFRTMNGYMGERQNDFADYYHSSPVMVGSTIFFGAGESIYAINVNDGNPVWIVKTGGLVHTTPAISAGRLFAGSFDGYLYSIDITTGNVGWKFKTTGIMNFPSGEVTGNPVVSNGIVFASARDNNLYAIDVNGGYAHWLKNFPKGWALPVTVNDSAIYVGTSDDRTLFAYDIVSGRELWQTKVGFNILGGCAIGDKQGYFGTLAGKVHAVDLTTGKIEWTLEQDSYKANHLSWLKEDDTYRDDIGKLIKNPADVLKLYTQLGGIFSTPAKQGDIVVVGGYDGWVYCYGGSVKQ